MSKVLPQINNIVYLMMENRSLDNVLGWLYTNVKSDKPAHVYPKRSKATYDGLIRGKFYNPAHHLFSVKKYPVVPIPAKDQKERVPWYDPYEAMREGGGGEWNGVMNQLFGNQDKISSMPGKGQKAKMLGFLQDYYAFYMRGWEGLDSLWTYNRAQLPHINQLARAYAVSDHWFSSVPTQTNPNRAYSLCGTSLGREANSNLQALEQFDVPTLINKLAEAGKTWGLYYEDIWHSKKCFTEYTFPHISHAANGEIDKIARFKQLARSGKLPDFTYLEPKWGYGKGPVYVQGHDYHPPTHVTPGDNFLLEMYTALRNSPQWNNTLFIVSFDEHGGTYDHVAPPWGAINPDGINGTKWGFKFDLFGVRVPTLLISPYIQAGTVFREPTGSKQPYDHTSFIKTVLLWAGVDPETAGLGKRVIAAPKFDGVLADRIVNTRIVKQRGVAASAKQDALIKSQSANKLFDGLPFSCTRHILGSCETLQDIKTTVARCKSDPEAYEAMLREEAS